ncbi:MULTISPECIES: glucose 1-dehydrogenase [Modestobacter]|jgi:NAD(P)-dependent dehydrogenase (short-subunit alcohol dehydrogenase family)|uniref:Oxidoreductase n=1 Tax=Modestobacter caceresii TaxID=1522368 RepID=A0A098Y8S9_9ACTN|nr:MULTISPECIES: glucose 1-dehydrogenase [Modestobacter]KGH46815.1 oxidoreductase [Modestobacter caceresii]
MPQLAGKVALITGGNSGIGFGTAKRMVEEGAFVYITGRNQESLDRSAAELGENARAIRADVTSRAAMDDVVATIRRDHGRLDIVFANAGAAWYSTVEDLTEEEFDKGFGLDGKGTLFTVQAALPLLREGASIIVNTSITQTMGLPTFGVYAASKSALRSFVRTWMNELRDRRIRVNAISPGVIETESYAKDMGVEGAAAYVERVVEEIPVGRIGRPEDIGNAVVFLASDAAGFINGTELTVDGGQTQIYAGHN